MIPGKLFVMGEQAAQALRNVALADAGSIAKPERADVGSELVADDPIEIPIQGLVQGFADNPVGRMPQGLRDLSSEPRQVLVLESDLIPHGGGRCKPHASLPPPGNREALPPR